MRGFAAMPLSSKLTRIVRPEIDAELTRLQRDHERTLAEIYHHPRRHGAHVNSGTHGGIILSEICKTYEAAMDSIEHILARALPFQEAEPLTTDEVVSAFNAYFEPARVAALEHSRPRLVQIKFGKYVNEVVTEGNRLIATFPSRAERIIAALAEVNRQKAPREAPSPAPVVVEPAPAPVVPKAITGTGSMTLGGVEVQMYGRVDNKTDLDIAKETARELKALEPVLTKLTDAELSALSTKSRPIGTFLSAKGYPFSVLTEDMLAEQFREELARRKTGWRHNWRTFAGLLTILTLVVAALGLIKCSGGTP
jgi:hypothetical protein